MTDAPTTARLALVAAGLTPPARRRNRADELVAARAVAIACGLEAVLPVRGDRASWLFRTAGRLLRPL